MGKNENQSKLPKPSGASMAVFLIITFMFVGMSVIMLISFISNTKKLGLIISGWVMVAILVIGFIIHVVISILKYTKINKRPIRFQYSQLIAKQQEVSLILIIGLSVAAGILLLTALSTQVIPLLISPKTSQKALLTNGPSTTTDIKTSTDK